MDKTFGWASETSPEATRDPPLPIPWLDSGRPVTLPAVLTTVTAQSSERLTSLVTVRSDLGKRWSAWR